MEILLGFKMGKTGENLEYWVKNFTQILGHILIRDTDNEIYWVSPPRPGFLGVFFFCPETAVERIEQLWVKLKNSICNLVHGVKCYIFSLEHILDWHLDVATIVLYLFFKSTVTSTRATNLNSQSSPSSSFSHKMPKLELIKSRSNLRQNVAFALFARRSAQNWW